MFQPCILEPTRSVDKNRPALIDNIFINFTNNDITSGKLISKISDHMQNFILTSKSIDKLRNLTSKIRNFKKFTAISFKEGVDKITIDNINDVDTAFDKFQNDFINYDNIIHRQKNRNSLTCTL